MVGGDGDGEMWHVRGWEGEKNREIFLMLLGDIVGVDDVFPWASSVFFGKVSIIAGCFFLLSAFLVPLGIEQLIEGEDWRCGQSCHDVLVAMGVFIDGGGEEILHEVEGVRVASLCFLEHVFEVAGG